MRTIVLPPYLSEDTADMLRHQYWAFGVSLRNAPPRTRSVRIREWTLRRAKDFNLPADDIRLLTRNIYTPVTYVRS